MPLPPSVEAPIEKGGVAPPLKILETWLCSSYRSVTSSLF